MNIWKKSIFTIIHFEIWGKILRQNSDRAQLDSVENVLLPSQAEIVEGTERSRNIGKTGDINT